MWSVLHRRQFAIIAGLMQTVFIVLFAKYVKYIDPLDDSRRVYSGTDYPLFQDVHLMIFVGFGFLMAFLKRYGFSAVSVNLLLSAFVIQFAMLLRGFMTVAFQETGLFSIGIPEMISAESSCAAVLITMGVLLGRLTPVQFLLLAFFETGINVLVEHYVFNYLHVNDSGRSLSVHTFGAYFGLAAACVGHKKNVMEMDEHGGIHHSDLFSMIGTLLLWVFFPSFNAAIQEPEDARHRAIMNTYLAMASGTVTTFMISSCVDTLGRFNMIHIQSSTLAGGVAIGSSANAVLHPYHAVIVGVIAALLSVIGHAWISPRLERTFHLFDTCGVHNLHGMPGILAGLLSIGFAYFYEPESYGKTLYHIYPYWIGGELHGDRENVSQAQYQALGLLTILVTAVIGGLLTGCILKIKVWNQVDDPDFPHGEMNYYAQSDVNFLSKYKHAQEQERLREREQMQEIY
ncbi:Ammonium transporter AmtB-like domain-containing protein [Caenorhabditis elegans]|uniref:Ammonium transporter AmtB-like domain-containing protein n=1 Tax=Caenorhabditis elegans TaxID=6239 RepID=Q17463_CAEEL|nr:Ammonium transporter AmtB-like domain-containing protein [Caenorhabditis elegans]CAA98418.1 Ammonium transporter AmtB-like domain-containing protein [Caenorhabditis elegans]|eukprot:NP_505961.1 RH (Rhesus) antigen Related [Caenorhabditis elegans]